MAHASSRSQANKRIRSLYDRYARHIDVLFGRITENSPYRRMAVARLGLTERSSVLDVACGVGSNFKIIESYLHNTGAIVGIDISSESLKMAQRLVAARSWTNVRLINANIASYTSKMRFDGILCTFALEIIAEYETAVNVAFDLLKPGGRFAMLGMKTSCEFPYWSLNRLAKWGLGRASIDLDRNLAQYIESRAEVLSYEECFHGFYFVLSASRRNRNSSRRSSQY